MHPSLWVAIGIRVLANPCSNALQKLLAGRGISPLVVIGLAHLGLSALVLPWLFTQPLPAGSGLWLNLGISAALATVANVLIVQAVHESDLSLVGPINSYKPVVSLLPGLVLLGEVPSLAGLVGIGLVVAGSYLLVQRPPDGSARPPFFKLFLNRGVQLRIAALIPSAIEAVFLKRALSATQPSVVFAWWALLCLLAAGIALTAMRGWRAVTDHGKQLTASFGTIAALVLTTGLMQFCTVVTLAKLQVGYSLALFQTSTVISVIMGRTLFNESHFHRRLVGSVIMCAGAAVIVIAG